MPELNANVARYYFDSPQVPPQALQVARFAGTEEISRLFRFELDLVSDDAFLDFNSLINQPATLTMMRGDEAVPIQGVIVDFEQWGRTVDYVAYRAVLVPRLWWLSLTYQSRIFQRKTVPDIVEAVLKEAGFAPADYRLDIQGTYEEQEYRVQYRETDLNFISRLMEHEGIFYFFEHTGDRDVLVIADTIGAFQPIDGEGAIDYKPGAGMVEGAEKVQEFIVREKIVPGKVVLKDYNYRQPDMDLQVESQLNTAMPGMYYEYGDHYKEVGVGKQLAKVRNEEIECRRRVMRGASNCAGFRSGYTFTLAQHYRNDLDADYLFTRLEHGGSQWWAMGLLDPSGMENPEDGPVYRNAFTCVPADVMFRPERRTPEPRVPGIMTARVESGGGDYAYIDDGGRYRARMHFDLGDAETADATRPLRMSQPHSGPNYGVHFPNHDKTEMVWACIDGNVDRPLALGTVPNPNNASPSVSQNNYENVIRTKSGNQMIMNDTLDKAQILINTPDVNSMLFDDKDDRIVITTTNKHVVTMDDKNQHITAQTTDGHFLLMDDKNKKITLQSKDGHRMSINDADKLMTIVDESGDHRFEIDIGNKKLTIKTETGDIDIHAPKGHIEIKSKTLHTETEGDTTHQAANISSNADQDHTMKATNITCDASMDYTEAATNVTSEATADHVSKGLNTTSEAGVQNDVKGSLINVKASGINTIQGSLVKIN